MGTNIQILKAEAVQAVEEKTHTAFLFRLEHRKEEATPWESEGIRFDYWVKTGNLVLAENDVLVLRLVQKKDFKKKKSM